MEKKLRAIIVDDENLAREELRVLLSEHECLEIVGEASNAKEAKKLIEKTTPDVVFLDIQMPGESGLNVAEEINNDIKIIFVTAFDEHAIRAFEINALDYLIKPVYPERLEKTINRLVDGQEESREKASLEYDDHIFVKLNRTVKFIKINSIVCINSAKEYTEVFTTDGSKSLILQSLIDWENKLPDNQFVRIHRSTIININYIDKIEPWFNNSYKMFLKHIEEPQMMSRRYTAKIKTKLGLS